MTTHSLAALVESIIDAIGRVTICSKEPILDHAPEGPDASGTLADATLVGNRNGAGLAFTKWLVRLIEGRVDAEGSFGGLRRAVVDAEAVSVGCDSEKNLVGGELRGSPSSNGRLCRAQLILGGSTRILQRCVGASGLSPRSPDVVVHDGYLRGT